MKSSSNAKQHFDGKPIPISRFRAEERRRLSSQGLPHGPGTDIALIAFISRFLNPMIVTASLALLCLAYGESFTGSYLIFGIFAFLISLKVIGDVPTALPRNESILASRRRRLASRWVVTAALVWLIAFVTGISTELSTKLMLTWLFLTPFLLVAAQNLVRRALPKLVSYAAKTALVVGANPLGVEFARRINQDPYSLRVLGFFDDRALERLPAVVHKRQLLGNLADLSSYLRRNPVDLIYISLPIVAKARVINLVDELRNTTASVCFVPDLFAFDLIQARLDDVNGFPVVHVRESPFVGLDGVMKRGSDVLFSSVVLLFIWPVLLAVALAVKLTSHGPIFFRQRYYGLCGEEIVISKFRTAYVGDPESDERVTGFGRFLRTTGLERLPQFVHVVQGKMSIVGPELHMPAQAELYRKLLDGYMLRYKIRPGMTGWAQVHGFRAEAENVQKMYMAENTEKVRKRVEYDLDYMRHWSPALDLEIIARTVLQFSRDSAS